MSPTWITVVAGFTRSGSTLMMRMLHAGGIRPHADNFYSYEHSDTLGLPEQTTWLGGCVGRAVKVLENKHFALPPIYPYRFILMTRDPHQQALSNVKFLETLGKPLNSNSERRRYVTALEQSYATDLPGLRASIQALGPVLELRFEDLIEHPAQTVLKISKFMEPARLDGLDMTRQVISRGTDCLLRLLEVYLPEGVFTTRPRVPKGVCP